MKKFGQVTIGRFQGGRNALFGMDKTSKGGISIAVSSASLEEQNQFGDKYYIRNESRITEINFTHEQWMQLLLDKNNLNGVPCTITGDENGYVKERPLMNQNNSYDTFSEKIDEEFKVLYSLNDKVICLIKQDKLLKKDKEAILDIFRTQKDYILENLSFVTDTINDLISDIDDDSKTRIINNITQNIIDSKQNLLEDKSLKSERYQGIMVLEDMFESKGNFIKDYHAENGISITIYRAVMSKDGNISRTNDVLVKFSFSTHQFSEFISNFNQCHMTCTIENFCNEETEAFSRNIDDDVAKVESLLEFIDNTENRLNEASNLLNEKLKGSVGKTKRKEIEFIFEKVLRNISDGSMKFFAKEVFDSGYSYSIRRQADIKNCLVNKAVIGMKDNMKLGFEKELLKIEG